MTGIDEREQRRVMEPAPFPDWWEHPQQTRCTECGRRRYDTKTRLNLHTRPELCAECFEDPSVLACYVVPRR